MAATTLFLENVVISMIKPVEKSGHPAFLELSSWDLFCLDLYMPIVFFYRPDDTGTDSFHQQIDHLKKSLSKVLVLCFPFAGRWVKTYDARIRELQCTDEGVPFIEGYINEDLELVANTADYVPVHLLGGYELLGLDPTSYHQEVDSPLPLLFIQVTRFKCGGIALHVTLSHMFVDGQGMLTFIQAWAETALHGQTAIVPSYHRLSTTSSSKTHVESLDVAAAAKGDVLDEKQSASFDGAKETVTDTGAAYKIPKPGPDFISIRKTVHVKRKAIEDLKREAAESNMVVTTVDLITAHIWRSVNNIPESVDHKTASFVIIPMEARNKYNLPKHFFGNVVVRVMSPRIPSCELATKSHLFAANIIHDTVKAVNPSALPDTMDGIFKGVDLPRSRLMGVSSWFRFPMYEIDFGCGLGKPFYATDNFSPHSTSTVFILPPPPGRAHDTIATLDMMLQGEDHVAIHALLADSQFLSFFH